MRTTDTRRANSQVGLRLAVALLLSLLASLAAADAGWVLTRSDFAGQAGSLDAITSAGVQVGGQTVPMDQFLQIQRTSAGQPQHAGQVLFMANGDRIYGSVVAIKDEKLTWRNALLGDITLSLRDVRAFVRPDMPSDDVDKERKEDQVVLANKDIVRGIVASMSAANLIVTSLDGEAITLSANKVAAIYFAATAAKRPVAQRAFRVRLTDDSQLGAAAISVESERAMLTLADKSQRGIGLSAVLSIEQINGPVSWLSTRQPAEVVQTPYFSGNAWPTQMDKNVTGGAIRLKDRAFSRGIGVHAYSRLVYVLDGGYDAFRAQYAIDGNAPSADVTVRIKLDDKVVHEQQHVTSSQLSPLVQVELGSAKRLTLEVDYGANYDVQDRLNWIEPALVRRPASPAAVPPASMPATRP